jgi:uncharacterized protein
MDEQAQLEALLKDKNRFVLAFSGGLDSSLLVYLLKKLGKEFCAVTVDNGMLHDLEEIKAQARKMGIRHEIIRVDLLKDEAFVENSPERCYLCKKAILQALRDFQEREGYNYIVDATNASDLSDYRAGIVALKEEKVLTPLLDLGMGKEEITKLSREFGVELKAPESCLATRVPVYTRIRKDTLDRIRRVENRIKKLGFSLVRARVHGKLLRIEVLEEEMRKTVEEREEISKIAREEGFGYITLDLTPYPEF